MTVEGDQPRFREINWDNVDRSRSLLTLERLTFLCGLLALGVTFWYDRTIATGFLVGNWNVTPLEWAVLLAIVVLVAFGVVPAARNLDTVRGVLRGFTSRPVTLFGAGYLALLLLAGLLEPFFSNPGLAFPRAFHPPVGVTGTVPVDECLGPEGGTILEPTCQGTMDLPLGANRRGHPMGFLLLAGARVTLYVLVFTGAFVVPLAAIVGVVAGLRGGRIDDALMGYVDLQLCLPAIIVYIVANTYYNTSLLVLLATFGLLSWGGIARLVRSETLQRREAGHVRVARGFGASWTYIARRHILPNVTNTLLPAAFQLLALLVLVEAGIAYLGFNDIQLYSWGSTISEGLSADPSALDIWWVSTFPAIALVLTVFSLKLVGDGLRDALDPRGER
jgi:peptide/nickel transport system permease protein